MAVREGRWDCQYCGTKGILGRYKVCPQCATSRPEGTKFYLPEDEGVVEAAALQKQAALGPDWICEYCRSSNPADVDVCRHCSAPREGTSPQQTVKDYDLEEVARSGDMTVPDPAAAYRQEAKPKAAPQQRPRWLLFAAAGVLILLAIICGVLLFGGSDLDVSIAELSWERSVAVQAVQTITEEDWEVPADGRLLSQREEVHHYDQVLVGYETKERQVAEQVQVGERTYVCGQRDLGNGFFEDVECTDPVYETQYHSETYEDPVYEPVPVYATRYTYEIDRWVNVRTARASGNDQDAYWPELSLADGERAGEREEQYHIIFVDGDGKQYEMEFDEEMWRSFEPNGRYKLKVNSLGKPLEVIS